MTKTEALKSVADYMRLPYTVVLRRDSEGDVVAKIEELPGCIVHGEDESEALANLREVQELWLSDRLERGQDIPLPIDDEDNELPSGKWVQRVSRSLHLRLTRLAKKEKVSLNSLVATMLSDASTAKLLGDSLAENFELMCTHASQSGYSNQPRHLGVGAVLYGGNVDYFNQSQKWLPAAGYGPSTALDVNIIRNLVVPETTGKIKDNAKAKEPHHFYDYCR